MQREQLIPADDFCASHQISLSFISSLQESGLIELISVQEHYFIHTDQLHQLEKMVRLHFEMDINLEGLETIAHLLDQLQQAQQQINALNNKVRFYEVAG